MDSPNIPTVTVNTLPASAVLLDVREDEEWAAGHIDGALHVPMNQVPATLAENPDLLTADTPVVCICKGGGRSAHVTMWLNENGYDAHNFDGGMLAWAHAKREMVASHDGTARVA